MHYGGGLVLFACLLATSACAGGSSASQASKSLGFKLVTPGTLTVATFGEDPPLETVSRSGAIGGVEGEWSVAFAKAHHLKIKAFQTTFAGTILAVQEGKADVAMSLVYTAARAQHAYYTYPSDVEGLQVFTRKGFKYTGPSSLKTQKVGTLVGYVWLPWLQTFFGSNLITYATITDADTALGNGQIDGFFEGVPVANVPAGIVPHNPASGDYGIPGSQIRLNDYDIVSCNNPDLAKSMDAELSKLRHDGQWTAILKKNKIKADAITAIRPALKAPKQLC